MPFYATRQSLLENATTVAAGTAKNGISGAKTYDVWGTTTAGSGAATVQIQGSANEGLTWNLLGTITLTLGTSATSDGFTSDDRYTLIRGNVTAISGTGAAVNAAMGY
jgi:hypothetical protein